MLNWVLPIIYVGYIVWRQWQPRLVTASYKLDALILAIGVIIAGTAVQNDWVNPNAAGWLIIGLIAVVSVGLLSIARTLSEEMWVTDEGMLRIMQPWAPWFSGLRQFCCMLKAIS
ncbi:hypothetical protein P3T51_08850 [Weissella confusa]|uniref:hypothetical protein n=1 Tax=Weissella confusa TaxID=1583 RepID=UPI002408778C|nr:hypothetical protein [Weissella confusa]WEY47663.1 hypothetical protein P3T51_08850 [Weissella confusa]